MLRGYYNTKGYRIEHDEKTIYHSTAIQAIKEMCGIALQDIATNTSHSKDEIDSKIKEEKITTKNLQEYVGKLFIHTEKAIRNGCPNYRLYCVAKVGEDLDASPTQFLCAWKVDRETIRHFFHPAFCTKEDRFILIEDLRRCDLCCDETRATNGSTPTATFVPDSYYKEVSLQQAIDELKPFEAEHTIFNT